MRWIPLLLPVPPEVQLRPPAPGRQKNTHLTAELICRNSEAPRMATYWRFAEWTQVPDDGLIARQQKHPRAWYIPGCMLRRRRFRDNAAARCRRSTKGGPSDHQQWGYIRVAAFTADLSQIGVRSRTTNPGDQTLSYAAILNACSMKRTCPTTSPFANHLTCPLRIMFIASYS